MRFHVGIQTVEPHHTEQCGRLQFFLRQIGQIGACGVALVFYVEFETLLLDGRCQIVDVFHHQAPVGLLGVVGCILQRLDEETPVCLGDIRRELAHLIRPSPIGVLEGHGQHLVGLQSRLQRHIAKGLVDGIFAGGEQTRTRQFLVVDAPDDVCDSLKPGCDLVDASRSGVDFGSYGRIERVGLVAGYAHTCRRPLRIADIAILAQFAESHDIARV